MGQLGDEKRGKSSKEGIPHPIETIPTRISKLLFVGQCECGCISLNIALTSKTY